MANFVRDENRIPEVIAVMDESTEDVLKHLGEQTVEKIDEGFDSGEDALGREWEPLAPETIQEKGHDDILIDSGDMRDSFAYAVDEDNLAVRIGTDSELVPYHEFGTQDIPQRPILKPAYTWLENEMVVPAFDAIIGKNLDQVTF